VDDVNFPPVAADDLYNVLQNSRRNGLPVLDNDSDPDVDDVLAIAAVGAPNRGGTVRIAGSTLVYTPTADYYGAEVLTYTVSDGHGGSDTALVVISVGAIGPTPSEFLFLPAALRNH
jgi:hypothetical protein